MGYIESNLLPDERIVYRARMHWLIFWKATAAAAAGVALVAVEPIVGLVVFAISLIMFVPPFVAYKTAEFGVTTKRIIVKVGLVQRRTIELLPRQVEAISVGQSILGRIFDYGSITLSGTGGVREVFHDIARPLEFRRQIQSQTA
jgi:uncharacterized membrane protein YdbT with pleckstrin-like domain